MIPCDDDPSDQQAPPLFDRNSALYDLGWHVKPSARKLTTGALGFAALADNVAGQRPTQPGQTLRGDGALDVVTYFVEPRNYSACGAGGSQIMQGLPAFLSKNGGGFCDDHPQLLLCLRSGFIMAT